MAQIMMLKPLMEEYPSVLVTEKTEGAAIPDMEVYWLRQVNRKEWLFPIYMMENLWSSCRILWKTKPDLIITTGVLATVPLCLLGKLLGKKLIFIESFAKVETGTLTGRILYPISDAFFVQWESMRKVYPKAIWKGGLY